jgi:energy-coupling factor transporter ATP-binding protein EcfA2
MRGPVFMTVEAEVADRQQIDPFEFDGLTSRRISVTRGLTVVTGRNGSGKSSFAEAAELVLTEDGEPGTTTVTREWAAGAALDDAQARAAEKALADRGAAAKPVATEAAARGAIGPMARWWLGVQEASSTIRARSDSCWRARRGSSAPTSTAKSRYPWTGQFLQGFGDQRGGLGDGTAALRDPRAQERELWPGEHRARGEPVQQLVLGGSREPIEEHPVPGCEVLGAPVAPVGSLVETSGCVRGRLGSARPAACSASR